MGCRVPKAVARFGGLFRRLAGGVPWMLKNVEKIPMEFLQFQSSGCCPIRMEQFSWSSCNSNEVPEFWSSGVVSLSWVHRSSGVLRPWPKAKVPWKGLWLWQVWNPWGWDLSSRQKAMNSMKEWKRQNDLKRFTSMICTSKWNSRCCYAMLHSNGCRYTFKKRQSYMQKGNSYW